ncbi:MAG: hypothetical protein CSA62_15020 [Planctomycetota bacterium]|nr:MAG: hypothetical protein CSA62_15020 [Planctomycetota bacterium]
MTSQARLSTSSLILALCVPAFALAQAPQSSQEQSKKAAAPLQDDGPDTKAHSLPEVLAEVELKLSGRVNVIYAYDNFQGRPGADYAAHVTSESPDESNFTPRDTRFGFSAHQDWGNWKAKAVCEMDFYGSNAGDNYLPRLRHGYLQFDSDDGWRIIAGQTWNPIARQLPSMMDLSAMIFGGDLGLRVPQIRVGKTVAKDWVFEVSAFKHRVANSQQTQERMPWLAARAAYRGLIKGKGEVALNLGFRDVSVDGNEYSPWIIAGEFKLPLSDNLTINGEIWGGEGIGPEFVRYGLDYNKASGKAIRSYGGFISGSWKWNDKINSGFGVGYDNPDDDDVGAANTFRSNLHFFVNTKYQITKRIGFGAEFNHLETEDASGNDLSGQRVQAGVWFLF